MISLRHTARSIFLAGLLAFAGATHAEAPGRVDPELFLNHVKHLSSPEMRGRGTGSEELDRAADYVAEKFKALGLRPAAPGGFFQYFPVSVAARFGSGTRLEFADGNHREKLSLNKDFQPLNFSASGEVSAPLAFAGYGITAPEYGYDDYAGLNVKGKVVIVLYHEPQEFDAASIFAGRMYTRHAQSFSKAMNARLHGARGIIFVGDAACNGNERSSLEEFAGAVGPADSGVPAVEVSIRAVARWLERGGLDLVQLQKEVDRDLKPRSLALPERFAVTLRSDVTRTRRMAPNVAAYIPGETAEHVVIGAHYDHVGGGEAGWPPNKQGGVFPGADDNASGTAGLLELARRFSSQPKARRGLLFLAFAGEELGLLGSSHYIEHPLLPLSDAVAMINLDMIGRITDRQILVGGINTGSTLHEIFNELLPWRGYSVDFSEQTVYGSSDHHAFLSKSIPSLFFFSGLHPDYHRSSDTWEKIKAPEAADLLDLAAAVIEHLSRQPDRPAFQTSPPATRTPAPPVAYGPVPI